MFSPMSDERRAHARISVEHACVLLGPEETCAGLVRDVSPVGAQVVAERPVAPEDGDLLFRIEAQEGRQELDVRARVIYARQRLGELVMGLQFVDMDAATHRAVHAYVDAVVAGSGGRQREHPRVQVQVGVVCQTKSEIQAVMRDLSQGGLSVELDEQVETGEPITVTITLGSLPKPLQLSGEVVHVRTLPTGRQHVGVRFSQLVGDAKATLRSLVTSLATEGRTG